MQGILIVLASFVEDAVRGGWSVEDCASAVSLVILVGV